ncbi:unnamed protein product [Parnassius mnemosyne]|uniref:Integrase catalytic domain-containing protein n=1 Tax=Parnassius mnemosyne TaxID=213953 RepID=A0AAV1LVB3_9NEOP
MGTHKTRTTSYQPQSNGMVERFYQTLERYLAKVVEKRQRDCDRHIQPFLLSYRSAVHESTSVTPAFASFGRELRLPADLITGIPPDAPRSITDYANDLRNKMNDIYEHVRQTAQQTSEKLKTRYDRKMNNKGFDEGSLVWLHNPVRSKGNSPKLQAKWDGPYRIVTRINDVTYRIQKSAKGTPKIVHVDRLACYYGTNNARDEHVLGGGSGARHY